MTTRLKKAVGKIPFWGAFALQECLHIYFSAIYTTLHSFLNVFTLGDSINGRVFLQRKYASTYLLLDVPSGLQFVDTLSYCWTVQFN